MPLQGRVQVTKTEGQMPTIFCLYNTLINDILYEYMKFDVLVCESWVANLPTNLKTERLLPRHMGILNSNSDGFG